MNWGICCKSTSFFVFDAADVDLDASLFFMYVNYLILIIINLLTK